MLNNVQVREAEFVDLTGVKSGWGIGRSFAYELLKSGQIRSVNLRREGRSRGKRLVEVASIREYLASCAGNIDPALSEQLRRTRRGEKPREERSR